jgi:hypothetical protein
LWADRVHIQLRRDALTVLRLPGRGAVPPPLTHALEPADAEQAPWRPAVSAFAASVVGELRAYDHISVSVSSHFARYVVAPGSSALRGAAEEEAHSRQCFGAVHASGDEKWTLQSSSPNPRRTRLVCGIETELLEALGGTARARGVKLRSIQPELVVAFNHCRRRFGWPAAWLVMVEPGMLCAALLAHGEWKSVRCDALRGDWREALPGLLAREELLLEAPLDCERVVVAAGDGAAMPARLGRWQIESGV